MKYILSTSHEPYFNIASEEYFLENFTDDIFLLYINDRSIIIGRNQNTPAEINLEYVEEENIPVVRRMSGGGAVFHDLGNLNYSFITTDNHEISFKEFSQPIIAALNELGVKAEFSGRNDLTIEGAKFSGTAQYHQGQRMIHHGTLLFSSNLGEIAKALTVRDLKFQDKAVKSVRSRVTTIGEHLNRDLSLEEFIDTLAKFICEEFNIPGEYILSDDEIAVIQKLRDEKYSTWEWNYGRSPKANFHHAYKFPGGIVEYYLNIVGGKIVNIKLYGDFFGIREIMELEEAITGVNYRKEDILAAIEHLPFEEFLANVPREEFVQHMF